MKLKEKFLELAFAKISSEELRDECEQIADEFAIGFAEWSVARAMGFDSFKLNDGELEIYKKEKRL